eukprot:351138-Chlamydomonas_euryale.AAC.15
MVRSRKSASAQHGSNCGAQATLAAPPSLSLSLRAPASATASPRALGWRSGAEHRERTHSTSAWQALWICARVGQLALARRPRWCANACAAGRAAAAGGRLTFPEASSSSSSGSAYSSYSLRSMASASAAGRAAGCACDDVHVRAVLCMLRGLITPV